MNNKFSLYIHIPFCISKCDYCDFFSIECKKLKIPDDYINALCRELLYRKKQFDISELKTIYVGGGTPSLLTLEQIKTLFNFINNNFTFCEVIN